ncbi:uncharacterized protein LOC119685974 [Teleopsis dalmanni]|uniref:uncharacterized protein LOC119685974 n=1 Tax=Teleopsis dalmanni TaxID=139649 RepID=UPI0018CF1B9B|nr:uncharacterized protein LOC119685974 [Teleopsis dalmanni]
MPKKQKVFKRFNVGDYVFARLQGYPPWPAKVTSGSTRNYKVFFFGTADTATIKVQNIFKYKENKNKFCTARKLNQPNFCKAIQEIEDAIKANNTCSDKDVATRRANRKVLQKGVSAEAKPSKITNSNNPRAATVKLNYNNMLFAMLPSQKCIAITFGKNKPKSFSSVSERVEWEATARNKAESLKERLEIGEITPDLVKNMPIVEVPFEDLNSEISAILNAKMVERKTVLIAEKDFVALFQQLRKCLGLKSASVDRCLDILDKIKMFQINKLSLLRNPDCIDIMRRLCRYVGNLANWNLSSDDLARFVTKAATIREKAISIYNNFKKLCNYNGEKQFWNEFSEEANAFEELTRNFTVEHRLLLTKTTYQKLLSKQVSVRGQVEESNSNLTGK